MIPRILIKHVAGSKANRIDQFQLDGAHELIIGRGSAANVAFDSGIDDTVSRRHAIIKIMRNDRLSFTIADLGSSNGVRVNGRPVRVEQVLLPDDIVELSPGGPAFRIAVEPETLCLADKAPTRQMPAPYRDASGSAGKSTEPQTLAAKASEPSRPGPRYSRLTLLTVLAVTALGMGAVSFKRAAHHGSSWMDPRSWTSASAPTSRQGAGPHAPNAVPAAAVVAAAVPASPSVAPIQAAKTPSAAIVDLEARWRLYDKFTGKPVFQKAVTRGAQRLPCFVELSDGRIVPWLTTEDEEHTNSPIGGVIRGTGFIVSARGSIITNRRIAAGWTVRYRGDADAGHQGLLFQVETDPVTESSSGTVIDLTAPGGAVQLTDWIPGDGGFLFHSRYPAQLGAAKNNLEGRNEVLNVLLPSSHAGTPARLISASADADVAELKIDVDRQLPVIPLADDAETRIGERVTTLGYARSLNTSLDQDEAIHTTGVAGRDGQSANLPALTSAEGTIIGVDRPALPGPTGATANASSGAIYQLSVNAAHPADGGPVLDGDGRAMGILSSDTFGQTTHTYVYSIRFVRALLQLQ
jgi:hypothetical protein